eukprot:gene27775-34543_t
MTENDNIEDDSVTLGFMEALCEDVLAEESLTNTLAILLNPGIQYSTWSDGIHALLEKNLVTIITGKSHLDRMTTDAVHCERILTTFYGANMLIHTTKTPARKLDTVMPGLYRNLFYVAFQGKATDTPLATSLLTSQELIKNNQIAYLKDQAVIARHYECNEVKAKRCETLLEEVEKGCELNGFVRDAEDLNIPVIMDGFGNVVEPTVCHGGFYSVPGDNSCRMCPAGTFSHDTHSDCTPCHAGSYSDAGSMYCIHCPAGSHSQLGASVCDICPAGTYAHSGATSCTSCDAGTFSFDGGAECTPCSAGSSSPSGASTCTHCAMGYYSGSGFAECEVCAAGMYAEGGARWCSACPAGTFSGTAAGACHTCPAGTSSVRGSHTCKSCRGGTYAAHPGSTSCDVCEQDTFSLVMSDKCDACPPHTTALPGSEFCSQVPSSAAPPTAFRQQQHDAQQQRANTPLVSVSGMDGVSMEGFYSNCKPGFALLGTNGQPGECAPCHAGSYSGAGAVECTTCRAGTVSSAQASFCMTCESGTSAHAGQEKCSVCAAGSYASSGSAECVECEAGSFSFEHAETCSPCAAGSFSGAGYATCEMCSAGKFSDTEGARWCNTCSAGTYSEAGSALCETCPSGSYSHAGSQTCTECTAGSVSCLPCGSFSSNTHSSQCTSCSAGEYSMNRATKCNKCAPGTYSTLQSLSATCIQVPVDFYADQLVGATTIIPCPANSHSPAGSTNSTACIPDPSASTTDSAAAGGSGGSVMFGLSQQSLIAIGAVLAAIVVLSVGTCCCLNKRLRAVAGSFKSGSDKSSASKKSLYAINSFDPYSGGHTPGSRKESDDLTLSRKEDYDDLCLTHGALKGVVQPLKGVQTRPEVRLNTSLKAFIWPALPPLKDNVKMNPLSLVAPKKQTPQTTPQHTPDVQLQADVVAQETPKSAAATVTVINASDANLAAGEDSWKLWEDVELDSGKLTKSVTAK